eukprot:Skav204320  [mRNA]  locus=scaffold660:84341:84835:- [translate_table: standard]
MQVFQLPQFCWDCATQPIVVEVQRCQEFQLCQLLRLDMGMRPLLLSGNDCRLQHVPTPHGPWGSAQSDGSGTAPIFADLSAARELLECSLPSDFAPAKASPAFSNPPTAWATCPAADCCTTPTSSRPQRFQLRDQALMESRVTADLRFSKSQKRKAVAKLTELI